MVSGRNMTSVRVIMFTFLAIVVMSSVVSGRYLPTRSQDDRLDRLRELLKDLLQNQSDNFRGISTGGEGSSLDGAAYPGLGAGGAHSVMFKRNALPIRSNSMTAFNPGTLPLKK